MPIGLDSHPDTKFYDKDGQMEKANKLLDYLDEIHELAEQLGLRPSEILL
jgi:hypothetical protein